MDSKQLKELKALLRVLRENGVTKYDASDLKLELNPLPEEAPPSPMSAADALNDQELTPEQLMFYSATPSAEEA